MPALWGQAMVGEVQDTYQMPSDGWVCFHCGERFTTPGGAAIHFGRTPESTAGCLKAGEERGLLMEIRRLEAEIMRLKHICSSCDQKLRSKRAWADHPRRQPERGRSAGRHRLRPHPAS